MPVSAYQILGIGAPVVDTIIHVPDDYLISIGALKGGMEPISHRRLLQILAERKSGDATIPGGSAANTVRGLAMLGHQTAFLGRTGNDAAGEAFSQSLSYCGIKLFLKQDEAPTSHVACLVTPDKERTMRAFLGASKNMSEKDLSSSLFENVRLVHIEGYRLLNGPFVRKAMELAKHAGCLISFDAGSVEIVDRYKKEMIDLAARYVDILFANAEEAKTLTRRLPKSAAGILKDICPVAVVLSGKDGCFVGHSLSVEQHPAFEVDVVDSTGAGDLFVSGFLHGFLAKKPLQTCARFGALTGSAVIQVHGSNIPEEQWKQLRLELK